MGRNIGRYSAADISRIKAMRKKGMKWKLIAEKFSVTPASVKNAVLYRDGATGSYVPDVMPRALRPWPSGVNFNPDELQVRA
jgi:hypothetical protein